ncbi:hypothetical protein [Myxococcus sp. RHSTA-1-4]|uniref:hypothetical protein n=1 Tax=Myxococcus sp. RHSTA-1-4 TaxID=2874601 RepID=UPI001CBE103C|nr:hypothetical protein [Myxococcus sp. RHSTA-1-4]MBZ4423258.1 hypothetical protein [Myxococcus sp. RHSTA-1-4]
MSQPVTAEALLRLVYRYYPAGIDGYDPRYAATEETKRLEALRRGAVADQRSWKSFLERIRKEMPGTHVWDYPNILYDPAYSVRVALPDSIVNASEEKEVVLMVCILAPVHILYADHHKRVHERLRETITHQPPLPAEFQPFAERLEALAIEAFGTTRLPEDVLSTPVPDLQVGNLWFGKVTLADCLFGDHRW